MFRLRFAPLAVVAGLALICGCLSLADRPLLGLNPFWRPQAKDCCETGTMDGTGPVVEEFGPPLAPGGTVGPLAPQTTVPQLAPAPRLVPEPQSRTAPYNPKAP